MSLYYHIVSDDSFWSCADAVFMHKDDLPADAVFMHETDIPGEANVIDLPNIDELRVCLKFYGYPLGELADMDDLQRQFTEAIQNHLDAFAQTRDYDNILSATTYAASTVSKFQAEGQYAMEARDATWTKGYEIMEDILTGKRVKPTLEEMSAELPSLVWPNME